MSGSITIEKKYKTVRIVAVILGVLLLISLFKLLQLPKPPNRPDESAGTRTPLADVLIRDGKTVPISPELKKFVIEGQYQKLILVNGRAQVKAAFAESGKEAEVCGIIKNGTQLPEGCDWNNIDLKFGSTIINFVFKRNPTSSGSVIGPYGTRP